MTSMILFWVVVFIVSLAALVKGADWLLESAEKIGLAMSLSPFIVGVVIVGIGTSLPELASSFFALFQGVTEIIPANAIGSNIANILLVVGVSAVIGGRLVVTKSLIDLDLPLLATSTVLLLGVVWDKQITFFESLLMLIAYGVYIAYTIIHKDEFFDQNGDMEILPSRSVKRDVAKTLEETARPSLSIKDFGLLFVGVLGLVFGAQYLISSVIALSSLLNIGAGVIAITAVALGTSLPELLVSAKAAFQKKSEIALGNIFGSNIFNALVVIGLPGLFKTLEVDAQTFTIGVPMVALATFLFIISGISRRIHMWEGAFYLILYILFVGKLFALF